jgi:hypothetical protein
MDRCSSYTKSLILAQIENNNFENAKRLIDSCASDNQHYNERYKPIYPGVVYPNDSPKSKRNSMENVGSPRYFGDMIKD